MSALFDRFRSHKPFRYSRWDGTQRLDDLDSESVLDALSDDYMKYGDLRQALNRMMQQGFTGRNGEHRMGLRDMMERLKQMRQQQMQRYNLSGVMDDILQKLEHIKQLERDGIQQRLDNANGQQPGSPQSDRNSVPSDGDNQQGQQGQDGQQGQQGQQQPGDAKAGKQSPGQQGQAQPAGQSGEGGESGQQGSSDASGDLDPDTLRKMLENIANRKLQFLESLPNDPAGRPTDKEVTAEIEGLLAK